MLAARISRIADRSPVSGPRLPHGAMHELQRQYYDTASVGNPISLAAITKFVPMTQVLFGSDFPFWPVSVASEGLAKYGFSPADLRLIERERRRGGGVSSFRPDLRRLILPEHADHERRGDQDRGDKSKVTPVSGQKAKWSRLGAKDRRSFERAKRSWVRVGQRRKGRRPHVGRWIGSLRA